jgi:formylglycine-generating enzyme
MTGNVWEWCSDFYDDNYYSKSDTINLKGPIKGFNHVQRGGSWLNDERYSQITNRINSTTNQGSDAEGFRCAADVK